jgi:DNA helicase II / ATP-dependent DNA helicase PcrA
MSFQKEKLIQKFAEIYNQLNKHQKQAVDRLEGPVMVIAGPGTGKTQILSARVGKILIDTDTDPSNILCLTYTDSGAIAMRRRLLEFIGPDAYKVNICTFHAFCNDVIQDNLSLFEKNALDPISDLERIEMLKQLIDEFPKNHPLKRYRGDVYYEIKNLQQLFSTMKKEGWTAAYINQKIDDYLADLPTREEFIYKRAYKQFKAGDVKVDRVEEQKERMEKLRAAVNEFEKFQAMMRKRNRYDFDDMINWVIKAFEENKNILSNYQERYLYILVDEYQDTSGTQNQLVKQLISYWDKPNIFVVGDDDQSIYRFQGANVENMQAFADSYKADLLTVVLTDNYRSIQSILDVSKSLINRNQERLIHKMEGLTKELLASNININHLKHLPLLRSYDTQRHEMVDITLQVEELLQQGIKPHKIGIIYKENKYGEELAQYFKLRNIPVFSKRSLNILDLPLAKKIILLLRYLATEHDVPFSGDEMLFEILHFDWFGIAPIEIAKLTIEVANRQYSNEKTSLRQLMIEKATSPAKDLFSQPVSAEFKKAALTIEKLLADVPNVTLQGLFENVIREAGVIKTIMTSNEKHWLLQVLTGLFDFVKEETHRNPSLNLKEIVSLFELMEHEDVPMPLARITGNDKGVNLLTAHGAKGLEFQYVFFAGTNSNCWEKKRKPGGGFSFPDTIFNTQPKQKEEEELRRLFYVALTRAEQHLYISYCCCKDDGKELEPSMFIEEIKEELDLPVEQVIVDDEKMNEFSMLAFADERSPEIDRIEHEFVTGMLDRFVMNVTALNNYLKCPLEFYFKNLIRIPSPKNEATEFGSAVHHAVEKLFRKMQDNNSIFPSKEEFIQDFEWYMNRHRESFTKEQFTRRMEYGHDVLSNYYDQYINTWNKIVSTERTFKQIVVDGVPIKGKLDKLEFDGHYVNVVDYKTGDPDKARPKLSGPNDKEPHGGDYWRQAVFYKILVDNYTQKKWQVISTEFDFVEPDKKKRYRKEKVVISSTDIEIVKQQMKLVWEKIQAREFYVGCGKKECHWCEFVKTNNLAVALHELNEDEEEVLFLNNDMIEP